MRQRSYGSGMTTPSKVRCGLYAAIAVVALVATWSQNIAYLGSMASFLPDFTGDLMATAASRSFTFDLLLLALAAAILMITEARKHRVRHVWAYLLGGVLIAISVTFPLFLIAREVQMSRNGN